MGRTLHRVKLIFAALALLPVGGAVAGGLSPGLAAYLTAKQPGAEATVLVVLREQVDIAALDRDLSSRRATRAERHAAVVGALQAVARRTQGPLLAELERSRGAGVTDFAAYWLVNAVRLKASEPAIRRIAARDDVDVVELNLVPTLIGPVGPAAQPDKALTAVGVAPGVVNIGARRVWHELGIRGEGALVGTLDTGVAVGHPALAARWRGHVAPWPHCWLDAFDTTTQAPYDPDGHGTHVTGTLTGVAPDDSIGVAPGALWIAANAVLQMPGPQLDADVLAALQFFTDPDGDPQTLDDVPDVVQNSWGVDQEFAGYYQCDSRWWDAIDACEAAGVVLIWSAGNEGPGPMTLRSPADRAASLDNAFSVGSTQLGPPFLISNFSSRGPAGSDCGPPEYRTKPEVVAPGTSIYSAIPPDGYTMLSGTSMAGPHVAGVVALMRSADPDLEVGTIKQILRETALDLGPPGEDDTYGHGLVDAYHAVAMVLGGIGWVEGHVRDADSGAPLAGARVTVAGRPQSAVAASDGSYRLLLPAGPATLEATLFAYAELSSAVEIVANATQTQALPLARLPAATLQGTVLAAGQAPPGGAPAAGVRVRVEGTPLPELLTDGAGAFAVELPRDRDYVFAALHSGAGVLRQTVPVVGDHPLDLYLRPLREEGFETGDFGAMPWTLAGDGEWFVQDAVARSGSFAARSGAVDHRQSASLDLAFDAGEGGELSFWYRVSSEANYDFLEFYLDGERLARWSGNIGWTRYATVVPAGAHALRWRYVKDEVVSAGQDCAWLDDVVLPGGAPPAPLLVPMPRELTVELASSDALIAPLVVLNQGPATLTCAVIANAAWLVPAVTVASVPAFGYVIVPVMISAAGLADGAHTGHIVFQSDDPTNPEFAVPVSLQVAGATAAAQTPPPLAILQAAPNPFNPRTTVRYSLPAAQPATLRLYDLRGRLVRTLVDEPRPAGVSEATWDGRDQAGRAVAAGAYLARLQAGGRQTTLRLTLVR